MSFKYFNVKNGLTTGNISLHSANANVQANYFIGNISVTDLANLGAVGNVKITGGTNGYVLQTDGTGNLSWAAQSSISASISNGNSNVNIPSANGNVNISAVGNANILVITGTGANISGTANITGNISAGNANLGNNASANFFTGNGIYLTGITTAGLANGNSNVNIPSANGNVNISAVGNANVLVITGTGANISGTANITGNLSAGNISAGSGSGGNITGANLVSANFFTGTLTTNAQPNITSVGTLTSLTVTGNVTGGNLVTAGKVYASEMIDGGTGIYLSAGPAGYINFFTTGGDKASISDTGNIIASNLIANSTVFATTANISANVTAGNANLGNSVTANYFTGTLTTAAQPNITSVGTLTDLSVSGNGVFGGNLTVNGTLTYINSTTLSISDPIINLQTGPNGAAPIANSGKDVGTALNYYDTSAKIAWMGWDVSNAEIAFGANVGIASEVVTFTSLANIRSGNASLGNNASANFFTGNGVYLTGITLSSISNGNSNVNIPAANGNVNISAVGNTVMVITGTGVNVAGTLNTGTGNANVGNLGTAQVLASANITTPQFISNIATGTAPFVVTSTTQVANLNVATSGTVTTAAQPNITSVGNLSGLTVSNATGIVNFTTTANVSLGAVANLHISGGTSSQYLQTDGTGNLSWATVTSGSTSSISNGNSNVNIPTANGNINFTAVGNTVMVVTGTGANISGTANITGNLTLSGANVSLGNISNLHITGGSNTYVLSTDGSGNLSWSSASGTNIAVDDFTGNGVQTAYTLTATPANINYTLVSIAGTFQPRTVYSLTGNVITFSSAPPNTAPIEVTTFTTGTGGGGGGITAQDLLSPFLLMGA